MKMLTTYIFGIPFAILVALWAVHVINVEFAQAAAVMAAHH